MLKSSRLSKKFKRTLILLPAKKDIENGKQTPGKLIMKTSPKRKLRFKKKSKSNSIEEMDEDSLFKIAFGDEPVFN